MRNCANKRKKYQPIYQLRTYGHKSFVRFSVFTIHYSTEGHRQSRCCQRSWCIWMSEGDNSEACFALGGEAFCFDILCAIAHWCISTLFSSVWMDFIWKRIMILMLGLESMLSKSTSINIIIGSFWAVFHSYTFSSF